MKEIAIRRMGLTHCECKMCGRSDNLLDVKKKDGGSLTICEHCLNDISAAYKEYDDRMLSFDEIVCMLLKNIPIRDIYIVVCRNGENFATTSANKAAWQLALEIVKSVFEERGENLKAKDLDSVRIDKNEFLKYSRAAGTDGIVSVEEFIADPYAYEWRTGITIHAIPNNSVFSKWGDR